MATLAEILLWFHRWVFELSIPTYTLAFVFTIASLPRNRRRLLLLCNRKDLSEKNVEESFPLSYSALQIEVEVEDLAELELSICRYLNEKTEMPILLDSTLAIDLMLSDAQLGQTVYELLAVHGREYSPGLLTFPLITVEDLIIYIESSPSTEAEADTTLIHSSDVAA